MFNFATSKSNKMKKLNLMIFALLAMTVSSCNTKVDLYSDKGDSTVVYMMLDSHADTNYAKITKSFVGNVNELAQNYAASNYNYDEIKAYLLKDKTPQDTIWLDTVSKWIPYDPNSIFYSGCYQTYYYTARELASGVNYKLIINRNDGETVSSNATTIDNFEFSVPNPNPGHETSLDITSPASATVKWKNKGQNLQSNAAYFEAVAFFRYKEVMYEGAEPTYKEIKWVLGKGEADDLYNTQWCYYSVNYKPSALINILENDPYLKNNSPYGVKRYIQRIRVEITGVGDEFYNYLIANNSSSAIQDTPDFSNIENGRGLMSSRVTNTAYMIPNGPSRKEITNRFPSYGFVYEPNDPTD